MVTQRYQQHGR